MSQRELAELVGVIAHHQVSNHERSIAIPSLLVALSYEAIFHVPVAEMFPGLYETIKLNVDERLSQMENKLQGCSVKGRAARAIAHKLEWLWERSNPAAVDIGR
jgi:transcriptional regulator with XRE-family HTH domain